ncbi:MAG: hypothetical protein AB8B69_15425 [Chitinophagales bacterium]
MSSKIGIRKILKDHLATLVDQNTNKPGGDDISYFLLLPFIISFCIVFCFDFDFKENSELKKTLISSLAIFVGLLFNALVMIINMTKDLDKTTSAYEISCQLISNISYSIIIVFLAVTLILFRFWELPYLISTSFLPTTSQIIDLLILFLLFNFFFTFFMVMKRTYLIINIR